MKHYQTDVLIIGAGPVGLFGIFQAGMLGMRVHVIDSLPQIGGQCSMLYPQKPIYDIPAYPKIMAQDLIDNLALQAQPFSPHYHLGTQITDLTGDHETGFTITTTDSIIEAKVIIIAAGSGAFSPNRPPLKGITEFEEKSVFYHIQNKEQFYGKKIVIAGGGDSAVDWANELAPYTQKLYFVHRRNEFKAAPAALETLKNHVATGKIAWHVPAQLMGLSGHDGVLEQVMIKNEKEEILSLDTDYLLPFYGLSAQMGILKTWNLDMIRNHIVTDPATGRSNRVGIYAAGDAATYPHKIKLILTGFAEIAGAVHDAYHIVFAGKALHFEYSTTKGIDHANA